MKLKGRHFLLSQSGIQETVEDSTECVTHLKSLIFCDAVIPECDTDPVLALEAKTIAKLAERFLRDYLDRAQFEEVNSDLLLKAFEYANEQLLRYAKHREQSIAVSAILLLEAPSSTLIAACVGDAKLYRIRATEASVVLSDKSNQSLPLKCTPRDRFQGINSALGLGDSINVQCMELARDGFHRFLAVSYGAQGLLPEDALHRLALKPHDPQCGVAAVLGERLESYNAVKLCTISAGSQSGAERVSEDDSEAPPAHTNRRYLALALSAAAAAVALPLLTLKLSEPPRPPQAIEQTVQAGSTLSNQIRSQSHKIAELQTDLDERISEIARLRERVTAMMQGNDDERMNEASLLLHEQEALTASLRTTLLHEQTQREELQSQLCHLQNEHGQLARYRDLARERESALVDLGESNLSLSKKQNDSETEIAELKSEVEALRARREAWHDREELLASYAEENAALLETLANKEAAISDLRDELCKLGILEHEQRDSQQALSTMEQELERLQRVLHLKEDKITYLEQNLTLLDDMKRQLDDRDEGLASLGSMHQGVLAELKNAQSRISYLEDSVVHMGDLRNQLEEREKQIKGLRAQIARDSQNENNTANAEELLRYEQELTQLRETVASLDELLELQEAGHEEERQTLENEIAELRMQSSQILASASDDSRERGLEAQVLELEKELGELHRLEQANRTLKAQLSELQKAQGQERSEHYTALESALRKKQSELQALQQTATSAQDQMKELQQQNAALERERDELSLALDNQDELLAHYQQIRADSLSEREELISQLDALGSQHLELEEQLHAQSQELSYALKAANHELLENEIKGLQVSLENLEAAYNSEVQNNTALQERLEAQTAQLEGLQSISGDVDTLRTAFNEEIQRSRELVYAVQASKKQLDEARFRIGELENLEHSYLTLKESHAALVAETQQDRFDLLNSRDTIAELQQRTEALEIEREQLRHRLGEAGDWQEREASLRNGLAEQEALENELRSTATKRAELEERLQMELEEKMALLDEHARLATRVRTLEGFEQKYQAEHELRLQKERRFAALAQKLQEQRSNLETLEASKRAAREELQQARRGSSRYSNPKESIAAADSIDGRIHQVRSGDTLTGLSLQYYGTTTRWSDIFEANREALPTSDKMKAGTTLIIPE